MKKLLIVLAFAGVSVASFAQDNTEKYSVATNSFWKNWFVQAGFNWNAWYTGGSMGEHGWDLAKSPFKGFRSNPGAAVAVGKWFSPEVGLRTKVQGIWGKQVRPASVGQPSDRGNKYWILNEHILLNLSNLFCGYNEDRVFNLIPFLGGGLGRSMTHDMYAMDLSAGLMAQFRLSKKFSVHAELGWNRLEPDIDGGAADYVGNRGWDSHHNNVYAELGLTFNLGKSTWDKVPDVDALNAAHQSALDALNAQLRDADAENARLRNLLANQKPVEKVDTISTSIKEFITTPVSVFFNLAKTNVANPKDLVNVRALAKYAKDNNSNILVTGYADSSTGTPAVNERLSLERAATVKDELIKMGVSADKISTTHNGGVKILGVDLPVDFDRRATVQITD